jgi:UTP:GlnB (protein PII) uridylyltransferase
MAKKTITKAESLAAKTERLMQAYFDLQDKMKEAERELREHVSENENKMFSNSEKYIVRYGEVNRTTTNKLVFDAKVSYTPAAVLDMFADADFASIMKKELGKTALENLIDKAATVSILRQNEQKKTVKALKN